MPFCGRAGPRYRSHRNESDEERRNSTSSGFFFNLFFVLLLFSSVALSFSSAPQGSQFVARPFLGCFFFLFFFHQNRALFFFIEFVFFSLQLFVLFLRNGKKCWPSLLKFPDEQNRFANFSFRFPFDGRVLENEIENKN